MMRKFKNQNSKFKNKSARIYGTALLLSVISMLHWPLAVTFLLLICLGMLVHHFLKYVVMMGHLNEDLRELNN